MGEIYDLIKQMSETDTEKIEKKKTQTVIDDIVNQIVKNAKTKVYRFETNISNQQYAYSILEFFKKEGFQIENCKTEFKQENNTIQLCSFDIKWE